MLSDRLQSTPCSSGGRSAPNRARGRNASMPNGPYCRNRRPAVLPSRKLGMNSVYIHTATPTSIPPIAPRAVA